MRLVNDSRWNIYPTFVSMWIRKVVCRTSMVLLQNKDLRISFMLNYWSPECVMIEADKLWQKYYFVQNAQNQNLVYQLFNCENKEASWMYKNRVASHSHIPFNCFLNWNKVVNQIKSNKVLKKSSISLILQKYQHYQN